MARLILLDEFHLSILAPPNLPQAQYEALVRALNSRRLHQALRAAVRHFLSQRRVLRLVRLRLSR